MQQPVVTPNAEVIQRPSGAIAALVAVITVVAAGTVVSAALFVQDTLGILVVSGVGLLLVLIVGLVLLVMIKFDLGTSSRPVHVSTAAEGVLLDGQLAVPAGAIVSGYAMSSTLGNTRLRCGIVEIHSHGRSTLRLALRSEDEGRSLLRALGLDASQRGMSFWSSSWMWHLGLSYLVLMIAFLAVPSFGIGRLRDPDIFRVEVVIAGALLLDFFLLLIPARIEVGLDGVAFRWLGFCRSVRYADLQHVKEVGGGRSLLFLRLELTTGRARHVPVPRGDRGTRIGARIWQAKASYDASLRRPGSGCPRPG